MILIIDKNGNVIPAASIQFGGRIFHAGNNVWRVSQAGDPLTNECINTVTLPFTVSCNRSLTLEEATRILTTEKLRFVTIWEATNEFTRQRFYEVTKEVTDINRASKEITVTHDLGDYTVTKDASGEVSTTNHISREITVSRYISQDRTKEQATVTEDITRERTVTVEVLYPYKFIITAPASVSRGTAFDITIQSYNISSEENDTGYTPAGDLIIEGECTNEADSLTPASTDNTGWSNGAKTVSCTITGGSGTATCTVKVSDPNSWRTGEIDIGILATSLSLNTTNSYVLEKSWSVSGGSDPRPVNQSAFDQYLANVEAASITATKTTFGIGGHIYLGYFYSYGWWRSGTLYHGCAVFNTNGQPSTAKYYLKFVTHNSLYCRAEDPEQYNYRYWRLKNKSIKGLYVAKGTWAGDYATASDWNSYADPQFISFEQLRHKEPAVDGQTGYSEGVYAGETNYVEIPTSWINTSGLTKIMCFYRTDPNPIQIGESYSLPTNIYGFTGISDPWWVDKLCVGGKI